MTYQFFALIEGNRIDDIRPISPRDVALLQASGSNGRWVPVADLQGHPDVIHFFGANVSQCFTAAENSVSAVMFQNVALVSGG